MVLDFDTLLVNQNELIRFWVSLFDQNQFRSQFWIPIAHWSDFKKFFDQSFWSVYACPANGYVEKNKFSCVLSPDISQNNGEVLK